MKKEKYEPTEVEIISFLTSNVLLTSDPEYEDDELPLNSGKP